MYTKLTRESFLNEELLNGGKKKMNFFENFLFVLSYYLKFILKRFRRTKQMESDLLSSFDMVLLLKPRDENMGNVFKKPLAYRVKLVPENLQNEDDTGSD